MSLIRDDDVQRFLDPQSEAEYTVNNVRTLRGSETSTKIVTYTPMSRSRSTNHQEKRFWLL